MSRGRSITIDLPTPSERKRVHLAAMRPVTATSGVLGAVVGSRITGASAGTSMSAATAEIRQCERAMHGPHRPVVLHPFITSKPPWSLLGRLPELRQCRKRTTLIALAPLLAACLAGLVDVGRVDVRDAAQRERQRRLLCRARASVSACSGFSSSVTVLPINALVPSFSFGAWSIASTRTLVSRTSEW
jgi:hypothetical protein